MGEDPPKRPADPRDEPYYIETDCPSCGTDLVLYDELTDEQLWESDELVDPEGYVEPDEPWFDEWCCPQCLDGVRMDWPSDDGQQVTNG